MTKCGHAIKYLCKNEKVCETIFACSHGAQVESFKQKNNGRKSRDIVPLSPVLFRFETASLLCSGNCTFSVRKTYLIKSYLKVYFTNNWKINCFVFVCPEQNQPKKSTSGMLFNLPSIKGCVSRDFQTQTIIFKIKVYSSVFDFREIKTIFKLNLNLNLKFNLNLNLKFNSNILNLNLQLREPGCLLAKNIPGSINSRNRPFNNKLYLSQ